MQFSTIVSLYITLFGNGQANFSTLIYYVTKMSCKFEFHYDHYAIHKVL